MVGEIKTLEERKEVLLKLGASQGYITYEQLASELKGLDIDSDSLDDLYNSLVDAGIDIVSEDGSDDASGEEITVDTEAEDLTLSKDVATLILKKFSPPLPNCFPGDTNRPVFSLRSFENDSLSFVYLDTSSHNRYVALLSIRCNSGRLLEMKSCI